MVPLLSLWLPILVAAILVFIVSSVIHMLLPYHHSDWRTVPSEDAVMDALRPFKIPPGNYMMPRPDSMARMGSQEFKAKLDKGPRLLMTVMRPGGDSMARNLALWFLYSIVVGVFAGYVAGIVLAPGTPYLIVFRITGTVAFAAYALGLWQETIWYSRSLRTTLKSTFDGLIYGLVTAGAFGWLWP